MIFDAAVISAVTGHMNGDHPEDNLLIARAFAAPEASESVMVGVDAVAGTWRIVDGSGEREVRIDWPGGAIAERPEIRREVVKLYTAACERLGVPAREEHQPETSAHGGHGHGAHAHGHGGHGHGGGHPHGGAHGAHGHAASGQADGPAPFSRVIRESSWSDHSDSEGATFMEDIMRGIGTREDYVDLVAQHFFMYEALEEASAALAASPEYAAFHPSGLVRLERLERDLVHLAGEGWRSEISAVPATAEYAARIREVAAEQWLPGIVAHHYTRYLGDLSGGQMIAKRVSRQHGFDGAGVEFYDFASLGSLTEFKDGYRAELDRMGETLDEADRARVLDEVRRAYAYNTAVFVDLAKRKAANAA